MVKLSRIVKDFQDSGAVNAMVNLFGFIDDTVFLTKSGEVGAVLKVGGRDYECLDNTQLNDVTRRFEACARTLDPSFRIYQYLIKRNGASVPRSDHYESSIVEDAVSSRTEYLEGKARELYSIDVYFVILFEGSRLQNGAIERFKRIAKQPAEAISLLSTGKSMLLIEEAIGRGHRALLNKVNSFVAQLREYVPVVPLGKGEAFTFFRRLLNYDQAKADSVRLQQDSFVDYFCCDSSIECHRNYLRVDDFFVKVLTMKEAPATTEPNMLRSLQELPSECIIVSEFKRVENFEMRKIIQNKRRHFHNSKTSMMSHVNLGGEQQMPDQTLVDDSAKAMVAELGSCLTEMELNSNYFGTFSFTVVLYDRDRQRLEKSAGESFKVFASRDATLFEERYNLLNAFLAVLPANYRYNLRTMYLLNTNYADLSFLFSPQSGEPWNAHLNAEYLAVLETNQSTPYYLNLHYQDIPHTLMLGMTGSGKSFTCNFLLTHAQKYRPKTVVFDLGGSYRKLTQLFGGSYIQIGIERWSFTINPFALPPNEQNLHFLFSFVKVLIESSGLFPSVPISVRHF